VIQRSDDWGRNDERWEMHCRACAAKHGLYTEVYNRKGLRETIAGGWRAAH